MIRKLLLLLFGVTLFYNTCNAQRWKRNYYGDVVIVERVKKERPPTIVVINNNEAITTSEMWQQTIHFRFCQFRLDIADYPTIENIAKFMKEHENVKIELRCYSSKSRGSWYSNYKLAERRLKSVCDALLQYGVDIKNRVELCVEGLKNHQYDEDSWNQCVIIKAI